jgi:transcriptional regulator with XRE-family HTH domain
MTATNIDTRAAIGEFIHRRRLALDITKSEAARRAGVSRRTWHEIEEGQRSMSSAETLALLDQALQQEEGTLYGMTSKPLDKRVEQLRRQAVDLISSLSLAELELAVDTMTTSSAGSIRADLDELRQTLEQLTAEFAAVRTAIAEPSSGEPAPRSRAGARRSRPIDTDPHNGAGHAHTSRGKARSA